MKTDNIKTNIDFYAGLQKKYFLKRGILLALVSGVFYAFYTTFLAIGMNHGVWKNAFGSNSIFFITFVLAILSSGINDFFSFIWALIVTIIRGKWSDIFRSLFTKPGLIMILASLIGGPIAGVSYVVAINSVGALAIPITALCPAIGAILGRLIFKQKLNIRIMFGIFICISSSIIIGISGTEIITKNLFLGILTAIIAAFGWGMEGAIAGFGTSVIDTDIAILLRQFTSGIFNLFFVLPSVLFIIGEKNIFFYINSIITDTNSLYFFVISSFCSLFAFSLWYKGNGMCGIALGMALNGAYAIWGPIVGFLIAGNIFNEPGWTLNIVLAVGSVMMMIGIFLVALNPLDLFRKKY